MDRKYFKFNVKSFVLLFISTVIYVHGRHCPLSVQLRCGGPQRCAMVSYGRGPPVPDCITLREAMLLEAYNEEITGPGMGIVGPRRYPFYPRRPLSPSLGLSRLVDPSLLGALDASSGVPGVVHLPDGSHVHVPVANSVRDESERINLNLTVHNENNNKHDQRGSGNVRVSQAVAGPNCTPCSPDGSCPVPMHCMWSDTCSNNLGCRIFP